MYTALGVLFFLGVGFGFPTPTFFIFSSKSFSHSVQLDDYFISVANWFFNYVYISDLNSHGSINLEYSLIIYLKF